MAHATATRPVQFEIRQNAPKSRRRIALILVAAAVVLAAIAMALCQRPFTEAAVLQDLREVSGSQVEVGAFHRTFPFPGCVLDGVIFRHGPSQAKHLITIERITVRGSYLGVLSTRVERIIAEGLHVSIPAFGTGEPFHTTPSTITVGEIIANGATVEFAYHEPDKKPLRFDVHEASVRNVAPKGAVSYRLKVHNPEPPGEVTVEGKFGAWNRGDAGETPISGEYTFEQADLGNYKGIAGILSSKGKFSWKTHVIAEGSIAGSSSGKGKTALIDFRSNNARIEDLLRLFVKAERAPMSGKVTLQARAQVPPADEEFLKKLKLRGTFGIGSGIFAKPSTQEGVNKLSAGARGEKDPVDPETVLTDLTGQVEATGGIATFTDLSFSVPGAAARMHGTYNLLNHKIDLHGQMQVDSKISNTESGAKALLLKVMEPFFKKKKKGEVVPVRISGTYEHPSFGLDLNDKKAQKVPAPKP